MAGFGCLPRVGVDPHAYVLRALYAAIAQPGAITYPEDLLNTQPA
jgi:hypothetical protein